MKRCTFCIQINCPKCHDYYLEYCGLGGYSLTEMFNSGTFTLKCEGKDGTVKAYNKFDYLLCCKCKTYFYPGLKELMWHIYATNILKNHE